jgi:hypothetical protein
MARPKGTAKKTMGGNAPKRMGNSKTLQTRNYILKAAGTIDKYNTKNMITLIKIADEMYAGGFLKRASRKSDKFKFVDSVHTHNLTMDTFGMDHFLFWVGGHTPLSIICPYYKISWNGSTTLLAVRYGYDALIADLAVQHEMTLAEAMAEIAMDYVTDCILVYMHSQSSLDFIEGKINDSSRYRILHKCMKRELFDSEPIVKVYMIDKTNPSFEGVVKRGQNGIKNTYTRDIFDIMEDLSVLLTLIGDDKGLQGVNFYQMSLAPFLK